MSVKIKNRHRLKSKDIRKYQNDLKNIFNEVFFNEKSYIETGDLDGINIIFIDGNLVLCHMKTKFFLHYMD